MNPRVCPVNRGGCYISHLSATGIWDKIKYTQLLHIRFTITSTGIETRHGRDFTVRPTNEKIFKKKVCTRKIQKDAFDSNVKNEKTLPSGNLEMQAVLSPKIPIARSAAPRVMPSRKCVYRLFCLKDIHHVPTNMKANPDSPTNK